MMAFRDSQMAGGWANNADEALASKHLKPDERARLPTLVVDGQTYAPGTSADYTRSSIATTGDPYNTGGSAVP